MSKGGLAVTVPGSRLMVFVDETGHEKLNDPAYPVFGLAGCVLRADAYFRFVAPAWRRLKLEYFGGEESPLHASSLGSIPDSAMEALARFFRDEHFSRIGVTVTSKTDLAGLQAYEVVATALLTRLLDTARYWSETDGITFILEQSRRGDRLARRYLANWQYWREIKGERAYLPVARHFMPKKMVEPGLEIADFVANTVGGQAHAYFKGNWKLRKDFKAIVVDVLPRLVSVIDINKVDVNGREARS
jgi:hypothetical protein